MYRTRRNPPTVEQVVDIVAAVLVSDLAAFDEFQDNAKFYKQVIKEALEAKYGKLKPAPKPKRKKAPRKPKRPPSSQDIQLEVKIVAPGFDITTAKSYGMVTLPKRAIHLADFVSDDASRYGLGYVQWMSVYDDKIAELAGTATGTDRKFTSMFAATDGHKLAVSVIDREGPSDTKALLFLPEDWRKAFKSGVLLAQRWDMYQDAEFPDFVQVLPNIENAKGVYEIGEGGISAFLAAKPRGNIAQGTDFAVGGNAIYYRYMPANLGYKADRATFPFSAMEEAYPVEPSSGLVTLNTSYMWHAFMLLDQNLPTMTLLGALSPVVIQGRGGEFAVVMPMRADAGTSIAAYAPSPVLPYDDGSIVSWDHPPADISRPSNLGNPKVMAVMKMVRKSLSVRKDAPILIAPVYVGGTIERWLMNGEREVGCIRLPGPALPADNTQYPITIDEDVFKGWLQVNWPTVQGVGGKASKDARAAAHDLIKQLDSNTFHTLPFPPLRGLDKLVSEDETRYGLTHVGINADGDLIASNGHIGILCAGLGMSRARRVGIPAELFVGKPVAVQSATHDNYAASGYQVLLCEDDYTPANISPIINGLKTSLQTIELSPSLISQILRFPKKKVNGGDPVLVLDADIKVEYHTEAASIHPSKVVATAPFVKDFPAVTGLDFSTRSKALALNLAYLQALLYAMTAEPKSLFLDLRQDFAPVTLTDGDYTTGLIMPLRLRDDEV